jgi:hypothetical protein
MDWPLVAGICAQYYKTFFPYLTKKLEDVSYQNFIVGQVLRTGKVTAYSSDAVLEYATTTSPSEGHAKDKHLANSEN